MGKNNLIVDAKNLSSIFKQFLSDENCHFVFSTDVVMNSWIDWCVMNPEESGVSAVSLERFIAWDNFKSQFMASGEENKTSIPALLRKFFIQDLLVKNSTELFFKKIINTEFANNYSSFVDWIAKILPSLKLWIKLRFNGIEPTLENQTELNANLDEEDQDFLELYLRYSEFLKKNNMFEPSWIIPDFSSVGKKFVVIYPELLDDYADYIDIFSKTEDFIIVNLPEFEENENGPDCFAFSDSRKELRRMILKMRDLVESKKANWNEIALNVPDLETYRPYLEREFERYCIPYVIRGGQSLTANSAGTIFSQISQCYNSDFSYDSVRQLLLNELIPWKENIKITKENLIREGQSMHCICSYSDSNSDFINDTWIEALSKTADINSLELNFYKSLKKDITTICEASSFENLQKAWTIFKGQFLEESNFSETANNILSTCINHLKDIIQIEKDFLEPLKIPVEKPFDFFLSEISKKTYTPQNKTVGVNVYKYKLSAAANIKIQFVIDASQKNLELPHKRLDFLSTEKRIALGLEKEDKLYNVSKLFIKLYGKSECYFSYAEDSFGGFAIAHNFLNTLEPASKEEKQKGPLYELDENDFILNEKNFILEKSSDFSSIKKLSENQKNQFETWFTKNQNSKKYVRSRDTSFKPLTRPFLGFVINPKSKEEPPKSSSEKIKNLIWEYLTVKRHSELPSITQSDLKNFFPCPRNWIFKNVLSLQEDSLDAQLMTPFTMGNINHKVLELFLKWCIKENNRKIPCVDISTEKFSDSDYQRISNAICNFVEQTILEDYKMDFNNSPLTKLVLISQKQAIVDNIMNFLLTFCKPLENKGFGDCSVAFSEEWISTAETDNQEIQNSIKTEKTQWAYSGKIDCVIIDDEENVYIVDFKTGKTPAIKSCIANDKKELEDFQIPQYITLLNSAKPNFEISKALFYSIKEKKPVVIVDSSDKKWGKYACNSENYQSTIEIFYDYTKHCISKIEENNLEPKKDSNDIFNNVDPYSTCVNCSFKQICRTTYSIK